MAAMDASSREEAEVQQQLKEQSALFASKQPPQATAVRGRGKDSSLLLQWQAFVE